MKIVTHDRYSFYNLVHHLFFDRENGRYIYFQGRPARQFSREGGQTLRYDYNRVMYRLDCGGRAGEGGSRRAVGRAGGSDGTTGSP